MPHCTTSPVFVTVACLFLIGPLLTGCSSQPDATDGPEIVEHIDRQHFTVTVYPVMVQRATGLAHDAAAAERFADELVAVGIPASTTSEKVAPKWQVSSTRTYVQQMGENLEGYVKANPIPADVAAFIEFEDTAGTITTVNFYVVNSEGRLVRRFSSNYRRNDDLRRARPRSVDAGIDYLIEVLKVRARLREAQQPKSAG